MSLCVSGFLVNETTYLNENTTKLTFKKKTAFDFLFYILAKTAQVKLSYVILYRNYSQTGGKCDK